MSLSDNAYGSVAGVAALVPRIAAGDDFVSARQPTREQVEEFINEVSGVLNVQLAQAGFKIPITQPDAKAALDMFVNQEVAAICEGINGAGRFGPTRWQSGSRYALVLKDVQAFIADYATGFKRLGAARTDDLASGVSFRNMDERGNQTFPLFQRSGFGDDRFQTDWDRR
jgi:hypothetical protein